jgi:hypothetical protein
MFMISSTSLFLSGVSRFLDDPVKKLRLLLKFAMRVQEATPFIFYLDKADCGARRERAYST